jgi:hypothetical protein
MILYAFPPNKKGTNRMTTTSATTTHQLTPRDKICLRWIGMQYAIRLDQLRRL